MHIFEPNKNGSRAKFECLKIILVLNLVLGALLLLKISRNLVEFNSFKTSCQSSI